MYNCIMSSWWSRWHTGRKTKIPTSTDILRYSFLVPWLAAYPMPGQRKRRRINGIDGSTAKEGLIELEVLSISGECMVTLNVSDSMRGRDLWNLILGKVPSKPGLQLVVSHTSKLVLNESLQQQGLAGELAQVSATYMLVKPCVTPCVTQGLTGM